MRTGEQKARARFPGRSPVSKITRPCASGLAPISVTWRFTSRSMDSALNDASNSGARISATASARVASLGDRLRPRLRNSGSTSSHMDCVSRRKSWQASRSGRISKPLSASHVAM